MSQNKREARSRAREAIAAQRRAEARRRDMIRAGIIVAVVVAVIVGLVVWKLNSNTTPPPAAKAASSSVVAQVTGVPPATLDTIGKGSISSPPQATPGNPVRMVNGKPSVLYVGAEYCPFCAAERWGMIVALSRFGTFSNLKQIYSFEDHIPTFTFVGSTYTSQYINFEPVEMYGNSVSGNRYASLQPLSADQKAIFTKFNSQGSFPFVDFANQATIVGSTYQPTLIQGKTQEQVAGQLANPSSDIAKAVNGTANAITAQICKLTNNQPANVCSSQAVKAFNG